jgi:O-antigen/teichoic acid export membrane protein
MTSPDRPEEQQSAHERLSHRLAGMRPDESGVILRYDADDWRDWPPATPSPAVSRSPFTTGPLMDVGQLDISRFPTDLLPDISQFDTTALLDISEWPTQPTLGALEGLAASYNGSSALRQQVQGVPSWVVPIAGAATDRITGSTHSVIAGAESYIALVSQLVRSSGIYALAALGALLVSLVLAPFLTHYLSTSDYGTLTILNTAIGLVAGITQLGLGSAFFRAYSYDYTSRRDRRAVVATVTALLCLVTVPVTIGVYFTAPALANLVFGQSRLGNLMVLAAVAVLAQNLSVPGFAWLRAESRAGIFAALSLANLLVSLIANIVLVGVLRLGVAGSVIATGSGYAAAALCTLPIILLVGGLRIRPAIARNVLAFGTPMVLSFISYWVLQLSDRYLLSIFGSLAQTATYAVAYSLGTVLSTIVISPFTLAWPATMYAIAPRRDAAGIFQLVFRWFGLLLLFSAFGLSLVGKFVLDWLFPKTYHAAAPIIPIVAASIVFYGIYFVFMVGANVRRKTWLAAVFTTAAAVINLALNLILIPRYGAMGAAASTLIAYILLAGLAYVANQRLYPVPYEIVRFVSALLSGVAIYLWSSILAQVWGEQWAWPINLVALVFYGSWLALLGRGGGALRAARPKVGV